jgi:YD repeat-containing protein
MLGAVYTQTGYGPYDGTVRFKNGDKLIFLSGILTRMQDLHGNFIDIDSMAVRLGGSTYPRVDFTYDGNGHITAMTWWYTGSPGSRQWTFGYDANQRLSTVTNPLGGVTRYTWTTYTRPSDGQVLPLIATITSPRNYVTFTGQYDTSGRITQVTAADAGVTTFAYTAPPGSDGTTTVTDPRNNVTSWSYIWPAPQYGTIKYGYRPTSMTDALGRTTTYQALLTGSQLISKITDFRGRITTLGWDTYRGNLTSVTKPTVSGGTVTSSATYEGGCSQCTSVTDPLGRQATATVDANGNVTQAGTFRAYHTDYS